MNNSQDKTDWGRIGYFLIQNFMLVSFFILAIVEKSWGLFLAVLILAIVIKKNWITFSHRKIFGGSFVLFFFGFLGWILIADSNSIVGSGGVLVSLFISFISSFILAVSISILVTPKKYR